MFTMADTLSLIYLTVTLELFVNSRSGSSIFTGSLKIVYMGIFGR